MKLRYEPNLAAGGAMGAVMALAVYYKVLDVEAAGLWSVALAALAPIVQGWIARHFTTPTAKLEDADAATPDSRYHPDTIDDLAHKGRRRKEAASESGGPSV